MGTEILERRFAAIGARLNIVGPQVGAPRIDVVSGTFDIRFAGSGRQRCGASWTSPHSPPRSQARKYHDCGAR